MSRQSITTGTTRFLQITLRGTRQIKVENQTHIRAIDAHSEGDRGDKYGIVAAEKMLKGPQSHVRLETSVV